MRILFGLAVATLLLAGPGAAGAQQCGDGEVAINELIQGVNAALGSCEG